MALGEGEVVSYGDVAHDAGFPGRARAVGSLLAGTDLELPWWRVVRSDGRLATDPAAGQAALLREEGVIVRDGRVVDAPSAASTAPSTASDAGVTARCGREIHGEPTVSCPSSPGPAP